jgi:hypothetical protein
MKKIIFLLAVVFIFLLGCFVGSVYQRKNNRQLAERLSLLKQFHIAASERIGQIRQQSTLSRHKLGAVLENGKSVPYDSLKYICVDAIKAQDACVEYLSQINLLIDSDSMLMAAQQGLE